MRLFEESKDLPLSMTCNNELMIGKDISLIILGTFYFTVPILFSKARVQKKWSAR